MKSSQDPQPLQVWALISRHFSTHIGCSTWPQYPPVFPCVCFHITFVPCLCLHLFYTAVGIHLIGHWLLGKCWLSAQQIRAPPCQICHASNPLLRHRCVVREGCDMKIYLALCCKRRPGGVTPSKPHLLRPPSSHDLPLHVTPLLGPVIHFIHLFFSGPIMREGSRGLPPISTGGYLLWALLDFYMVVLTR